jgi:hypothetical protein
VRRYKRGYKNVINKGIELNNAGQECELMMETSGHGALKENRYLDDGAFMSVKIIIEAARRRWQGRRGIRCGAAAWFLCFLCNNFVLGSLLCALSCAGVLADRGTVCTHERAPCQGCFPARAGPANCRAP